MYITNASQTDSCIYYIQLYSIHQKPLGNICADVFSQAGCAEYIFVYSRGIMYIMKSGGASEAYHPILRHVFSQGAISMNAPAGEQALFKKNARKESGSFLSETLKSVSVHLLSAGMTASLSSTILPALKEANRILSVPAGILYRGIRISMVSLLCADSSTHLLWGSST